MSTPELEPYLAILPTALGTFFAALFLTPLVGTLAKKFGFVDLPKEKRKRTDKSIPTRLHKSVKRRMGGIAVLIPFLIVAAGLMDSNRLMHGLFWGLVILVVGGLIDDKFELSAGKQMLVQALAAVVAVLSGVTIMGIGIAGQYFDFALFSQELDLGLFVYNFIFPADLITIFWILIIMNAINWMSGIDAIGELTTFVAVVTTMMLSVRSGQYELALLAGTLAGGLLGFVPFNMPPSKIMSGTAGTTGYGFILAVFAVLSGAKITSAVVLLSLPLIDMIWVMLYRLINLKEEPFLKRPFVGGNVHLHHRLMALGLNQTQTLWLEISIVSVISVLALWLAGFSDNLIAIIILVTVIIILFTALTILLKRKNKKEQLHKEEPPQPPMVTSEPTPEQKYAY